MSNQLCVNCGICLVHEQGQCPLCNLVNIPHYFIDPHSGELIPFGSSTFAFSPEDKLKIMSDTESESE